MEITSIDKQTRFIENTNVKQTFYSNVQNNRSNVKRDVLLMECAKMNNAKVYVPVVASFDADGKLLPMELIWEDGRRYHIDRILDIRQAAAAKAGGQGDRYTIRVNGQQSYLFFERSTNSSGNTIGRWFVERR
jgi:hypothetical protein